ncbi:hypothetical protein JB92DRAFT_2836045 [Gautieria morchelliformis]|nr:hypothetical protein JB92DRAFT_2836045 [Gautieria morchelliformis]
MHICWPRYLTELELASGVSFRPKQGDEAHLSVSRRIGRTSSYIGPKVVAGYTACRLLVIAPVGSAATVPKELEDAVPLNSTGIRPREARRSGGFEPNRRARDSENSNRSPRDVSTLSLWQVATGGHLESVTVIQAKSNKYRRVRNWIRVRGLNAILSDDRWSLRNSLFIDALMYQIGSDFGLALPSKPSDAPVTSEPPAKYNGCVDNHNQFASTTQTLTFAFEILEEWSRDASLLRGSSYSEDAPPDYKRCARDASITSGNPKRISSLFADGGNAWRYLTRCPQPRDWVLLSSNASSLRLADDLSPFFILQASLELISVVREEAADVGALSSRVFHITKGDPTVSGCSHVSATGLLQYGRRIDSARAGSNSKSIRSASEITLTQFSEN